MTARVLVVDDVLANVKLLEARLSAEYFEVLTAYNGQEALDLLETERVDVVLLDVMMPGMDGFEVCRRIKSDARDQHLPVVMVTALDQPTDKVQGLRAGADDFLAKPVDDIALVTRVRNLARLKALNDEMLLRTSSGAEIGLVRGAMPDWSKAEVGARILLVEDQERAVHRVVAALSKLHTVDIETEPQAALAAAGRRQLRSSHRQSGARRHRRAEAVQPGALSGAAPAPADHRLLRKRAMRSVCCARWTWA